MAAAEKTWGARLSELREKLNLDQEEMGSRLGVTREWISKLEREHEAVSELIRLKISALEKENELHPGQVNEVQSPYVIPRSHGAGETLGARHKAGEMVDPRHAPKPATSSRADCESYFSQLLDRAEADGDPDNFPTIMRRLKKQFPLDEFEQPAVET